MPAFSLVNSVFDFMSFGLLLFIFQTNESLFQTSWFVELVLSASTFLLVVRTQWGGSEVGQVAGPGHRLRGRHSAVPLPALGPVVWVQPGAVRDHAGHRGRVCCFG